MPLIDSTPSAAESRSRKTGRAIVITGVSRGLGFESLDLLIAAGARPIALGRTLDPRHQAAATAGRCVFLTVDLSALSEIDRVDFASVLPQTPQEIVFVSNAGTVEPLGILETLNGTSLAEAFTVNSFTPALLAAKLLAAADACGARLRIINIGTGAARRPLSGLSAYCASKAAAAMLFDCLAKERTDVIIEHVDPGVLDTQMQGMLRNASQALVPAQELFASFAAQNELRPPRDVAREILTKTSLL